LIIHFFILQFKQEIRQATNKVTGGYKIKKPL
jgi:hypothetical protein